MSLCRGCLAWTGLVSGSGSLGCRRTRTRTRFTRREAFCNFSFCAVVNSRCSVALALSRILLQFSGTRDEAGAGAEAGAGRRVQNLVLLPINATQVVEGEEKEGEEKSLATCGALLESAAEFAGVFAVPDCLSVCVCVCLCENVYALFFCTKCHKV